MDYQKAAVGGTFDQFHLGHQALLTTAFATAKQVVIGITESQLLAQKQLVDQIQSFEARQQAVMSWLNQQQLTSRATTVALLDPYGPTLTDKDIDILVVSTRTQEGAETLNQQRQSSKLPSLPIRVTNMVQDETGSYLSSTRIRQGYVSKSGKLFDNLFKTDIVFNPSVLEQLKQPQGTLVTLDEIKTAVATNVPSIILVGDTITQTFKDHNLSFNSAIIDQKTRRNPALTQIEPSEVIKGTNPPGQINAKVANQLIHRLRQPNQQTIYQINGEEDLLAFVPSLIQPLGTLVFYGQPGGGIVMMSVSQAEKIRLSHFIDPSFE